LRIGSVHVGHTDSEAAHFEDGGLDDSVLEVADAENDDADETKSEETDSRDTGLEDTESDGPGNMEAELTNLEVKDIAAPVLDTVKSEQLSSAHTPHKRPSFTMSVQINEVPDQEFTPNRTQEDSQGGHEPKPDTGISLAQNIASSQTTDTPSTSLNYKSENTVRFLKL
jgi:hypothetical protein